MPGKPPERSAAARAAGPRLGSPREGATSADPAAEGGDAAPIERIGPLALSRHLKADGRSLILYTRELPERT